MTEKSFPWGGTSIGDAIYSTYNEDEWSFIWGSLFCYDRYYDGVLPWAYGHLEVSNPAGTTIRLASGAALVDGTLYINDNDLDFQTYGDGVYYLSIVKYWSSKTVRAYLVKGGSGVYGGVDGSYWGINIAQIRSLYSGAQHIITDMRRFVRHYPQVFARKGGSATDWGVTAGSTNYSAYNPMTQFGVGSVTMGWAVFMESEVVTFPRAYSAVPAVTVFLRYASDTGDGDVVHLEALPTTDSVTIRAKRNDAAGSGTYEYFWIAIGPD